MSGSQIAFYRARAEAARRDADDAELSHVRERWTTAAEAWEKMATRAERTGRRREQIAAEKAAARAE